MCYSECEFFWDQLDKISILSTTRVDKNTVFLPAPPLRHALPEILCIIIMINYEYNYIKFHDDFIKIASYFAFCNYKRFESLRYNY